LLGTTDLEERKQQNIITLTKKLTTTIPLNIQTVLRKPPRSSYHLPNMPSKAVLTNQWRPTNPRPLNFSCPCRWSTDLAPVSWDNYIMIMHEFFMKRLNGIRSWDCLHSKSYRCAIFQVTKINFEAVDRPFSMAQEL